MKYFDEMHVSSAQVRDHYRGYDRWLARQPRELMASRREEAEMIFRRVGITFAVYGDKDEDGAGTERLIPFDLIPRIIPSQEWKEMEKGLRQRVTALNLFLNDVYHGQEILKAGVVPAEPVLNNAQFRKEMVGLKVPGAFTPSLLASTSCGQPTPMGRAPTTFWKTTCACPAASATCWKTAR